MQFADVAAACQAFFTLQPNHQEGAVALPAGAGLGAGSACGGAGRQLAPRYVAIVDNAGRPADGPFDHSTGKGWVKERKGDYHE